MKTGNINNKVLLGHIFIHPLIDHFSLDQFKNV